MPWVIQTAFFEYNLVIHLKINSLGGFQSKRKRQINSLQTSLYGTIMRTNSQYHQQAQDSNPVVNGKPFHHGNQCNLG